jgi:quercetin 2,3-dioxygenase
VGVRPAGRVGNHWAGGTQQHQPAKQQIHAVAGLGLDPHHPAGADAFNGRRDFNALVYVLAGSGSVGGERRSVRMGQLAVFGPGEVVAVTADTGQESRSPQLDVRLLGGEPIREPVAAYGPFVITPARS